jgi:hypothetical protein
MDSKKINQLATNVAPSIYDLTVIGDPSTGQLKKITLNQIASLFGSVGGVSSVAMTVPTGLTVTGSPITTSGTLAVTLTAGYSIPTTAKQTEWDAGFADRLKWDGGTSGLNASTARSSLGLVIGTDVLAYRTFGSAANNNTADFATAAQGVSADTAFSLRLTGASVPLSISSNVISISQASTSTNGFLSSTDWNTFNNKIGGSGTVGTIPLFTASGTIGNSTIVEFEGGVSINNYLYSGLPYFSYDTALAASFRITSNTNGNQVKLAFGTISGINNYSNIVTTIVDNSSDTKGRLDFQVRSGNNSYATPLSLAYTGAATFESSVTATSFVKSSGTSSQFLKADGSVDSNTYISGITSGNVTTALGYTPYNATNPSGYISGITSGNVTSALGYTPYNATNPSGYISGITSGNVTSALGYTPYNSTNPSGYITGITSGNVTTALGYTPYNSSNPSGYITSSALGSYLPLSGGTLSGNLLINGSTNTPLKITATEPYMEVQANGATNVAGVKIFPSTNYDAYIGNYGGAGKLWLIAGNADNAYVDGSGGSIYNRSGVYGTISDITLKENIVDATPKLQDILKLKVRNFNLIGNEEKQLGFIAQEFEEVFPNAISIDTGYGDMHGKKVVKTTVLIPMLVKVVQEQNEVITNLTERINHLEKLLK